MNQSIELHNSKVVAIRENQGDVQLDLQVCVYVGEGRPGIHPETGWTVLGMTIASGTVARDFEGDSLSIIAGTVTVGSVVFENMLPTALDWVGKVQIRLVGLAGSLTVTGKGLRVEPMGNAEYVEDWLGLAG